MNKPVIDGRVQPLRALTLANVAALRIGFDRIDFKEFAAALAPAISEQPFDHYALSKWEAFQTNPIRFLDSWGDRKQAEALFDLACRKAGLL